MMQRFSLLFVDRTSQVLENRTCRARDTWHAMALANRRLHRALARETAYLDTNGRVDVLDGTGVIVARIYCAEAIAASS